MPIRRTVMTSRRAGLDQRPVGEPLSRPPLDEEPLTAALRQLLDPQDERAIDPRWSRAGETLRTFALRPGKRIRPLLLVVGYGIARPVRRLPRGLWRFAASLELLHTFLLVHDDVADAAPLRRGGPALHHLLGQGRKGQDLAVVLGDYLFARAIEGMLTAGLGRAGEEAVRYWLRICRATAAGQYLDLELTAAPLGTVTLFETIKIAMLKTARYTFVAPLVSGGLLGEADRGTLRTLERIGRHLGIAFQLRDDLLGLYGDPAEMGKSADSDLMAGKPTFPVIAAYLRAPQPARQELERAWAGAREAPAPRSRIRVLVEQYGGRAAAERAIARAARAARRGLATLPARPRWSAVLARLIDDLASRAA